MGGQSGLCQLAADPGIEQKSNTFGFDVDAVAVTAGLQGDDFHDSFVPKKRGVDREHCPGNEVGMPTH